MGMVRYSLGRVMARDFRGTKLGSRSTGYHGALRGTVPGT